MPASRRLYVNQVQDYTLWTAGEYGFLPQWDVPQYSWTGVNMMRYVGGALGPRYGVKAIPTSGLSPTGQIMGMGMNPNPQPTKPDVWFVIGTAVYLMFSSTGVISLAGNFAATPVTTVHGAIIGTNTYLGNDGDGVYALDHIAGTLTAIAGSPSSCGLISLFGPHLVVAGLHGTGAFTASNFLWYSCPNDPTSWSAIDFIPLGMRGGARITGFWYQRIQLVIATSDGQWWTLRTAGNGDELPSPGPTAGGCPLSAAPFTTLPSLRHVGDNVSPLYPENAHLLGDGTLAFTFGSSPGGSVASLGIYTGTVLKLVPYLYFGNGRAVGFPDVSHQVVAAKEQADWFVMGSKTAYPNQMTMHTRGTYSQHQFQIAGVTLSSYMAGDPVEDMWVMTDGGGVAATPQFYYFRQYADHPGFVSDPFQQPGDASTTPFTASFSTPEHTSEVGYEEAVLEVTVDFLEWDTGSPASNHFDVTVTSWRLFQPGSATPSTTSVTPIRSYDNAAPSGAAVRKRMRFGFSDTQMGNGWQINLANIRGIAVERILVHWTNQLTRE